MLTARFAMTRDTRTPRDAPTRPGAPPRSSKRGRGEGCGGARARRHLPARRFRAILARGRGRSPVRHRTGSDRRRAGGGRRRRRGPSGRGVPSRRRLAGGCGGGRRASGSRRWRQLSAHAPRAPRRSGAEGDTSRATAARRERRGGLAPLALFTPESVFRPLGPRPAREGRSSVRFRRSKSAKRQARRDGLLWPRIRRAFASVDRFQLFYDR